MAESTNATIEMPALSPRDVLSDILRQGAQQEQKTGTKNSLHGRR